MSELGLDSWRMAAPAPWCPPASEAKGGGDEAPSRPWSRASTAESSTGEDGARSQSSSEGGLDAAPAAGAPCGAAAGHGGPAASASELHEVFRAALGTSAFAATLAEPAKSGSAEGSCIRAVSEGFQEMSEWRESALLGRSGRCLDAQDFDLSLEEEARARAAQESGAAYSCVRTLRKASGELFVVHQYTRGISVGTRPDTGEDIWYLLTIHIDITEEADGPSAEEMVVDSAFLQLAAQTIAARILSDVDDELSARAAFWRCHHPDVGPRIHLKSPAFRGSRAASMAL